MLIRGPTNTTTQVPQIVPNLGAVHSIQLGSVQLQTDIDDGRIGLIQSMQKDFGKNNSLLETVELSTLNPEQKEVCLRPPPQRLVQSRRRGVCVERGRNM